MLSLCFLVEDVPWSVWPVAQLRPSMLTCLWSSLALVPPFFPSTPLPPSSALSLENKVFEFCLSRSVSHFFSVCLSVCLSLHATTPPPSLCLKVVHVLKGSVLRIVLFMAPAETVTRVCACVCVCMCVNDMIGLASWVTEILNTRLTLY